MSASELIQFRVPGQVKADFERRCEQRGETVSEAARKLLVEDLYEKQTPLDKLNAAFASADEKTAASGLPEPTVEEIVAYCAKVRAERSDEMLVGRV